MEKRVPTRTSSSPPARYAHLADDPRQAGAARISGEIAAALNSQKTAEVISFSKS
ncbi:MAG TPA: hypothetical protein VIH93_16870 [Thermoanaerobaculia bacterium]|jgi:hypothetical protein